MGKCDSIYDCVWLQYITSVRSSVHTKLQTTQNCLEDALLIYKTLCTATRWKVHPVIQYQWQRMTADLLLRR